MPPVGFEPTIPAGERPQTYALDRAAIGTGYQLNYVAKILELLNEVSNKRSLVLKPEFVTIPTARHLLLWVILPSAGPTNKAAGRLFV